MSAAASPASGGIKLGADRKRVAALLFFLALAGFLWWRNSQDSDVPSSATATPVAATRAGRQELAIAEPGAAPAAAVRPSRRGERNADRNTLEMRPVDATLGNVDPTLRLELLERLSTVKPAGAGRSLFEVGAAPPVPLVAGKGGRGPIITPGQAKPQLPVTPPPNVPAVNQVPIIPITLKFYGFARPLNAGEPKRGFFLDGDVILVASEGEVVKAHYKIIKLQDHSAVVEDTANKNQQTLPLTPEARGEF